MSIPASVKRALAERSRGLCEAGLIRYGCSFQATDPHHVKSRARRGSNTLENLLHVCRPCHNAITDNKPGTDRFRTWSWQQEGARESDSPKQLGSGGRA